MMIELTARQILPLVMYDNEEVYISNLNSMKIHRVPYNIDNIKDPEEWAFVNYLLDQPIEGISGKTHSSVVLLV